MSNPSPKKSTQSPKKNKITDDLKVKLQDHLFDKFLKFHRMPSEQTPLINPKQSSQKHSEQRDLIFNNPIDTDLCCCGLPMRADHDRKKLPEDFYKAHRVNDTTKRPVDGFTEKHWHELRSLQQRQIKQSLQQSGFRKSSRSSTMYAPHSIGEDNKSILIKAWGLSTCLY